jgi:hypothetical protein
MARPDPGSGDPFVSPGIGAGAGEPNRMNAEHRRKGRKGEEPRPERSP